MVTTGDGSTSGPKPLALDKLIQRGKDLPSGIELYWQNGENPRVAVAQSDFDFLHGEWRECRSIPDITALPREALYRFTDVDLTHDGGIRLSDGTPIVSPWLGARIGLWRAEGQHFQAGVIEEPLVSFAQRAVGFGHWFLHRLSRMSAAAREVTASGPTRFFLPGHRRQRFARVSPAPRSSALRLSVAVSFL